MLIVVEGCVGAGKSTIAQGLADVRGSVLVLEEFEANPFLRAFYQDPIGNAIETEFAFLLIHYHQLKRQYADSAGLEIVADFHLGKDLLYADLNLADPRARRLIGELHELCLGQTPTPALLIFLSATDDLLVKRIRARRRDFEIEVDPAYYAAVNAAYENFFDRYEGKKLRISMDDDDFVTNPTLFDALSALVDKKLAEE